MKTFLLISLFIFSTSALASRTQCKITSINSEKPTPNSVLVFDYEKVLLAFNRGNGDEVLFGTENIVAFDTNAIWFHRTEDCSYEKTDLPDRSVRHTFNCGDEEMSYVASVTINSALGAGLFKSTLVVKDAINDQNKIIFKDCK